MLTEGMQSWQQSRVCDRYNAYCCVNGLVCMHQETIVDHVAQAVCECSVYSVDSVQSCMYNVSHMPSQPLSMK